MSIFAQIALVPLVVLPAEAGHMNDARLLVEAQLQAAAAAVVVLEKLDLPPATRAGHLLPLANELARLHAQRAHVDAAQLEEAEARAAADAEVQQLAQRLLRAMELCAAADYEGSTELAAAVRRLALAIEGELEEEVKGQVAPTTEQSGAAPER